MMNLSLLTSSRSLRIECSAMEIDILAICFWLLSLDLYTPLQDIGGGGFSLILASIFSSSRTPMTWSGSQPEVSQIAPISEEVTSHPPASRSSLN